MTATSPKKLCAICIRENGKFNDKFDQIRQVLGARLKKHKDQDLVQVTEPHWLRRGNLKPSELVCRPHLAILMRGMDYGCEGGCCSPFHRGARLCNPRGLRTIPPDWKPFFHDHPKIMAEDKFCMLICWGCYKKHMEKMSRFGNPMGRSLGKNKEKMQRSKSLSSEDFLNALDENSRKMQESISRFKLLHNVSSSVELNSNSDEERSKPLSTPNSPLSRRKRATTEMITSISSQSRTSISTKSESTPANVNHKHRGRKILKDRRSPSPPISLSPIRSKVNRRKIFQSGLSQSFSSHIMPSNSVEKLFEDEEEETSTKEANKKPEIRRRSRRGQKSSVVHVSETQISVEKDETCLLSHAEDDVVDSSEYAGEVETDVSIEMVTSKLKSNLVVKDLMLDEPNGLSMEKLTLEEEESLEVVSTSARFAIGSESDEVQYLEQKSPKMEDDTTGSSDTTDRDDQNQLKINSRSSTSSPQESFGTYDVPSPNTSTRSVYSTSLSSNAFSSGDLNRSMPSPDKLAFSYQGEAYNNLILKLPRNNLPPKLDRSDDAQLLYIQSSLPGVEVFRHPLAHLIQNQNLIGQSPKDSSSRVDQLKMENMRLHKTFSYDCDNLVVRRGQEFDLILEFSGEWNTNYNLTAEIMTGSNPVQSNDTHVFLPLNHNNDNPNGDSWMMKQVSRDQNLMRISLCSPTSCPIGKYRISFEIDMENKKSRWILPPEEYVILLFNPWCVDDVVFMNSEDERREYVLEDVTCTYHGISQKHATCRPWILGQFDFGVLDFCLGALEGSSLRTTRWNNPLDVTKTMCEVFHQNDNRVPPSIKSQRQSWFFEYFAEEGNVRNCVLLCSALRCLGIPCRIDIGTNCSTNSDTPMIVNRHYSEEGRGLEYFDQDVLRPQFCWVAVRMKHVNLQSEFGSWHALSFGSSSKTKGPTSIKIIKRGQIASDRDGEWFYSLLNFTVRHHKLTKDRTFNHFYDDNKSAAGELIVTKSIGERTQRNITDCYKFPEGDERNLADQTACMHCGVQNRVIAEPQKHNMGINVQFQPSNISYDESGDVDLITTIHNNEYSSQKLTLNIEMKLLDESGSVIQKLQYDPITAKVSRQDHVDLRVQFNWTYWATLLRPDRHVQATAFVADRDNKWNALSSCSLGVKYPELDIQVHGEFRIGGEITIVVRMRNSLPTTLRNCSIEVESSTLVPMWTHTQKNFVNPGETYKCEKILRCRS